jgi:predicted transcriptional regulator
MQGGAMSAAGKLAEIHAILAPPERLSAFFHMVNRIIPDGQVLVSIPPEMPAREALMLMRRHGFSQLPVKQGDSVLGIFTYRAFALEVALIGDAKVDASSLPVEEFLEHEKPAFARLNDEFRSLINVLDERDSVVVSGPEDLVAILTPMDVLRYLYSVANAFVLLEEIELALRALIRTATGEGDVFRSCVENALSKKYKERKRELPQCLEDMAFDEYVALLRDGRNWQYFQTAFGGTRDRTNTRLEPVRNLRNDVFHFKRELSVEDHERLTTCRDWLLRRVRNVQARRGGTQ